MGNETIGSGRDRRVQIRKVGERFMTGRKRAIFLDHLAETCNVAMSAKAAGASKSGVYRLRRCDAEFAALWRQALLAGYDRLEERLLQHAGAGVNAVAIGETEIAEQAFDPKVAMDLLRMHRATVEGKPRRGGGRVVRATREEAEAALLKKLDALAKRLRNERSE